MIFYQILSTNFLKEMYGDQSGEFVCGFWQDPDLEIRGEGEGSGHPDP